MYALRECASGEALFLENARTCETLKKTLNISGTKILFQRRVKQKEEREKKRTMDTNRLSKELREIASDKASGVSVELVDGNSLAHMRGTITGAYF